MRGKLLFAAGVGLGYVLGTRAGRQRYEQMKAAAEKVWNSPGIQKQVKTVEDFAAEKIGDIPGAVFDGVSKGINRVVARRRVEKQAEKTVEKIAEDGDA